ncbi:hypothetical protein LCGC14_1258550 [marine sediment metagenome]|uniref:Uncharacterized protein n=1 Tax=marine sediment metagenome TaxID=412755 RepID=A0A0F9NI22_9ZZZZ
MALQPLQHNPYQIAFLNARRAWFCEQAAGVSEADRHKHLLQRVSPDSMCQCGAAPSRRAFNRFVLIAGRRGGKSRIGAISSIEEAAVPETLGWVIAPTFKELHDYVWPAIIGQIPRSWLVDIKHPINESYQEVKLTNGSMIQGRPAEDPERLRGQGPDWAWFDEVSKMVEMAWDVFRPSLSEHRGPAWFTTSPRGKDWVYRRLYKPALEGVPGFWATRYRTADNPIIPREEIEEARRSMSPQLFAQEYMADFVTFEGAIYAALLTQEVILRTNDQIKAYFPEWKGTWASVDKDRPTIIGIDPGADHPFAAVRLTSSQKGIVCTGEYRTEKGASRPCAEHAWHVRKLAAGLKDVRFAIDRTQKVYQVELAQHGIYSIQAENAVDPGIERVKSGLFHKRLLLIEDLVPKLLDEMQTYRYEDSIKADGSLKAQRPFKKDEDLCDALRYAMMLWPKEIALPALKSGRDPATVPVELLASWKREQRHDRRQEHEGLTVVEEYPLHDFFV